MKPPKNLRERYIRVCATCSYGVWGDGEFHCSRDPEKVGWDNCEGKQYFTVCDGYKSGLPSAEELVL